MSAYDTFDDKKKFACRVIADHARATAFAIADGILPGNEGRNYVLRKIMRRAIYHGRQTLGFGDDFFHKVTDFVVDAMRAAYPELEQQRSFIQKMVALEEKRFGATLTVGLKKLDELAQLYFDKFRNIDRPGFNSAEYLEIVDLEVTHLQQYRISWRIHFATNATTNAPAPINNSYRENFGLNWAKQIETPDNIKQLIASSAGLYDTFGTPKDLIRIGLEERGFEIPEEIFDQQFDAALVELQKQGASAKGEQKTTAKPVYIALSRRHNTKSEFKGYETTHLEGAKVIALIKGEAEVESLNEGEEGEVVLEATPFYAESGGQVGDTGALTNAQAHAVVTDTNSPLSDLRVHKVTIERGSLRTGDTVTATVDVEKRDATRRNHTATHLLHAALREVLGTHVKQAGSIVAPNYLRFDFAHYQPLTKEEITEIERLVNYHILRNERVQTDVMAIEEAMRAGAMALFGEKYGAQVRVLSVPGAEGIFSRELCGGTHVRATGDIGLMKIVSDESIASGTRRIRAVTGADALALFQNTWEREAELAARFRTAPENVPSLVDKLQDDLKKARRETEELKLKLALGGGAASRTDELREVAGVKVLAREASGLDVVGVRQLSDTLLAQIKSGVVVIGRAAEGKVSLIVRSSDDVKGRVPAGQVIRALAPLVGGRGGGKPDMAEGGGSQPEKLPEALAASYSIVEKMLG